MLQGCQNKMQNKNYPWQGSFFVEVRISFRTDRESCSAARQQMARYLASNEKIFRRLYDKIIRNKIALSGSAKSGGLEHRMAKR